jgi:hypothetical protein
MLIPTVFFCSNSIYDMGWSHAQIGAAAAVIVLIIMLLLCYGPKRCHRCSPGCPCMRVVRGKRVCKCNPCRCESFN